MLYKFYADLNNLEVYRVPRFATEPLLDRRTLIYMGQGKSEFDQPFARPGALRTLWARTMGARTGLALSAPLVYLCWLDPISFIVVLAGVYLSPSTVRSEIQGVFLYLTRLPYFVSNGLRAPLSASWKLFLALKVGHVLCLASAIYYGYIATGLGMLLLGACAFESGVALAAALRQNISLK